MSQSINFLKSLPKQTQKLTAMIMMWIVLGTLGVFLAISLMVGISQFSTHQELYVAQQALLKVNHQYDKLVQTYPMLASETSLMDQVMALEQKIQAKQSQIDSIEHLTFRRGFSEYMQALAKVMPEAAWLNEIKVNHDSDSITLTGYSMIPDSVADLMHRLVGTKAYEKVVFNLFYVKSLKNYNYVKFSIATDTLGALGDKDV